MLMYLCNKFDSLASVTGVDGGWGMPIYGTPTKKICYPLFNPSIKLNS